MVRHVSTRAISVLLGMLLLAALLPAATAAAATTAPVPHPQLVSVHALSGSDPCDYTHNYHAYYATTTVTVKTVRWTHEMSVFTLAPGGGASRTITSTSAFKAGVTITAGVEAEAGIIFASAKASAGISLVLEGTWTSGTAITLSATNNTSSYQTYVMFDGIQEATGGWTEYQCQYVSKMAEYMWRTVGSGYWDSWHVQLYGVLNCADDAYIVSKYGSWSVQAAAVKTC